jgi:hypothetical protein
MIRRPLVALPEPFVATDATGLPALDPYNPAMAYCYKCALWAGYVRTVG